MIVTFLVVFAFVLLCASVYMYWCSKRFNITIEGFTTHGLIAIAAISWLITWLIDLVF